MNFQDFYAGDAFSAYSFLGAHPLQEGFVFRVYAPAAAKAALIGEFSDWQEIPMERIYERHVFFTQALIHLGVDPDQAEADACELEHVVSDKSFSILKARCQGADAGFA